MGRLLKDLTLLLDNDDLGRAFFEKLSDRSGIKLIDFDNFNNNSFHVVTELTCENDDEEFRPDITLLINGMPLIFIEVKNPIIGKASSQNAIASTNALKTPNSNASPTSPSS
ncbi:type I restriction endonuclease [Escherichia coli]|nr:type I restriction endonuclease [Escherichia coli]